MRVGTRITAATSVLVAASLGVYAVVDLRAAAERRRAEMEREARALATALRVTIENEGVPQFFSDADDVTRELARRQLAWHVSIVSRRNGPARATSDQQRQHLQTLIDARPPYLSGDMGDTFYYALPLRTPSLSSPDGYAIAGMVEVSGSTDHLAEASRDDLKRTIPLIVAVVGLLVAAIMWLSRQLVTRPIQKLIVGIDDVARGDLSRVLLSEREDEIGGLASRFNEMTTSLRESRAETERQNSAKMRLEERLSHTEKLATIGQLAAEIAHEVGTPLSVIAGRARSLARRGGDRDDVAHKANIIAEQASRITRIIQRLLEVTRQSIGSAIETEPVDLNELTLTTLDFLEGKLAAANIRSNLVRAGRLPPVTGHTDQLQQVLLNLLLNAVEAMPDGGELRVETSCITRRRPGLAHAPEQPTVTVEVRDSGPGIPPERRDSIFEPFYTSKKREGGTGLGLSVSHGIIKEHDGWIEVGDAPGGGAAFRVCLPAAGFDAPKSAEHDAQETPTNDGSWMQDET